MYNREGIGEGRMECKDSRSGEEWRKHKGVGIGLSSRGAGKLWGKEGV